jgi:uncharacterized membrane protein
MTRLADTQLNCCKLSLGDPKEPVNVNNVGAGIAIGAGVGAALGVAMGNIALGVGVGIAIGAALGAILQKKDR